MPNATGTPQSSGSSKLNFSFDQCKYLDKDVTKKFIEGEDWELLKGWVSYNLKKKKPPKKQQSKNNNINYTCGI